jgi:hypothetical protein
VINQWQIASAYIDPVQTGQEIRISNDDPASDNIHPMARVSREWNRI